jgi:hypothetical protein
MNIIFRRYPKTVQFEIIVLLKYTYMRKLRNKRNIMKINNEIF